MSSFEVFQRSHIDEATSTVMNIVRENITLVIDKGLVDVYSVLLLNNSKTASEELKIKMIDFKETLLKHLQHDLSNSAKEFFDDSKKEELIDLDGYDFREIVQLKWENTLSSDLENLQEKIIPAWIVKFKYVWKGLERNILEKVVKFKRFVQNAYPKSFGSCGRRKSKRFKSANLLQKDFLMIENDSSSLVGLKSNDLIIPLTVQFAAVFMAVLGFIILPFGAPIWLCLILVVFGEFLNFLIGAYLTFRSSLAINSGSEEQDNYKDLNILPTFNKD